MSNVSMPAVLVFAGTDPTGGAGMQADILTLASMGCHPLSVVTAVTVQDTVGVDDFFPIEVDWIIDQARSVLEDMPVAAIKIGMLGSVEAVAAIAEIIADYPDIPIVLDPVLTSGRGDPLANEELLDVLRDLLLPQTTILTPNSLEARRLVEDPDAETDTPELSECARRLIDMGCKYVLITGAHEQGAQVTNTLYNTRGVISPTELGSSARLLSWLWLHAGFIPGGAAGAGPRHFRSGQGSPGVHLPNIEKCLSSGHGPIHSRPALLGARG
jgi:hydroxymethylpyrimidine/phosphomethylpyrimidine kinase